MTCPSRDQLEQLLDGRLEDADSDSVERHVEQCVECQDTLDALVVDDTVVAWRQADDRPTLDRDGEQFVARLRETPRGERTQSEDRSDSLTIGTPSEHGPLGKLAQFHLVSELGRGGMGIVFRAWDEQLNRHVAIKVMHPQIATSEHARRRFIREAQAMAAVQHDYIVPVFQVGEDQGLPFLAMPLLEGESLHDRLSREASPALEDVIRIGRETAEGLAAAHARGLIHRDIKPSNIWLEAGRDRVKILDFGLARVADADERLSVSGTVQGTPQYMAPEQANGEPVDARCDLFSLGCVLYRMATGQPAFTGSNVTAILLAVSQSTPKPVRDVNASVPEPLSDLITTLLAKAPDERVESAEQVVEVLDTIAQDAPTVVRRPDGSPGHGGSADSATYSATASPTQTGGGRRPGVRVPSWIALTFAVCAVVAAAVIKISNNSVEIQTPNGTLVIDANESDVEIFLDGDRVFGLVDPQDNERVRIEIDPDPNKAHRLLVTKGSLQAIVDRFTLAGLDGKPISMFLKPEPSPPGADDARGPASETGVVWLPGPKGGALPGLIQRPAMLPGIARWQIETRSPRGLTNAVAASLDGRRLAVGSSDAHVRVYDAETLEMTSLLAGHSDSVTAVAWSGDGSQLATGSEDQSLRIWNENGTVRHVIPNVIKAGDWFRSVVWQPNGDLVAAVAADGLLVYNVTGRPERQPHRTEWEGASAGAWSPDGKTLIVGCHDGSILTPQIDADAFVARKRHSAAIHDVAWSPNGRWLATASDDRTVRITPADEYDDEKKTTVVLKHQHAVREVAWSPAGDELVIGDSEGHLVVWDIDGKSSASHSIDQHPGLNDVIWDPLGRWIAVIPNRSSVRFFTFSGQLAESERLISGPGASYAHAWSPDAATLVTVDQTVPSDSGRPASSLRLWDTAGRQTAVSDRHSHWPRAVAWNADGTEVATAGQWDRTLRFWNPDAQQIRKQWTDPISFVTSLSWHGRTGQLLMGGNHGSVQLIHPTGRDGDLKFELDSSATIRSIDWHPDGDRFLTSESDGSVRIWHLNGDIFKTIESPGPAYAARWTPDGRKFAFTSAAGVSICDADGNVQSTWNTRGRVIVCLAWRADGQLLATGHDGGDLSLWKPDGTKIRSCPAHSASLNSVSWTDDGSLLTTTSSDGTVRRWNAESGEVELTTVLLADSAYATFSAAGQPLHGNLEHLDNHFVCLVESDRGTRELLTTSQFRTRIRRHRESIADSGSRSETAPPGGLFFNGQDAYVQVPTLPIAAGQPVTFEAWVAPDQDAVAPNSPHATVLVPQPSRHSVALTLEKNGFWCARRLAGKDNKERESERLLLSDQPAAIGRPAHLAVVCDGERIRLYVNGARQQATIDDFRPVATTGLSLGANRAPISRAVARTFKGSITGLRISDGEQYTGDFRPQQNLEQDDRTIAMYDFSDGDGRTLKDISGNNYDGAIVGAKHVESRAITPDSDDATGRASQDSVAERVLKLGGSVSIPQPDDNTNWRKISHVDDLPDEFTLKAVWLESLPDLARDDVADLRLHELSYLYSLYLLDVPIDDDGLEEVGRMNAVRELHLQNLTNVTAAGFEHLANLDQLILLEYKGADEVDDECVAQLVRLQKLQILTLHSRQVSNAGLESIGRLGELRRLDLLRASRITDDGISQLVSLTQLRHLVLLGTQVTESGIETLRQALPDCEITWGADISSATVSARRNGDQ